MSSLSRQSNGRKVIQFEAADGRRRSIRLGKVSVRDAQSVQRFVDDLVGAMLLQRSPAPSTVAWVKSIDGKLYDRLAAVGLVKPRASDRLDVFLQSFIDAASTVKASTLLTYERGRKHLVEWFGADRSMRSITAGDADAWWSWMVGKRGLARNTARKSVQLAKQFWKSAKRQQVVDVCPFDHLAGTVRANRQRDRFITREQTERLLVACPDHEWRLLVCLARYGGLRIPSEMRCLRWSDVDWSRSRFRVHASKTEHHETGGVREVPVFPELLSALRESFEAAEDGSEYVFARLRHTGNHRTHLERLIRKAGLTPWPKLWHNMRASRETELAAEHPVHVAAAWIGNTPRVAIEHYLQVRDEDFEKAVQKAVQHVHASPSVAMHGDEPTLTQLVGDASDSGAMRSGADGCTSMGPPINGPYRT